MTLLRSVAFMIWIYGLLAILGLIYLPAVLISGRRVAVHGVRLWTNLAIGGLRVICGTKVEVEGLEKLQTGGVLIAAKHQSMWETMFLPTVLSDSSIVLKKELLAMPVFGWYAKKLDMIIVDRSKGAAALKHMVAQADRHAKDGRQIVIFPEGTRQPPGAAPDYKPGIAALYARLGLPCIPVAHNSGLFWQGKGILRRPGTIRLQVLDPIPPGLDRKAFMAELEARIETATDQLVSSARAHNAKPGKQAA